MTRRLWKAYSWHQSMSCTEHRVMSIEMLQDAGQGHADDLKPARSQAGQVLCALSAYFALASLVMCRAKRLMLLLHQASTSKC